jgi:hypothetical protein
MKGWAGCRGVLILSEVEVALWCLRVFGPHCGLEDSFGLQYNDRSAVVTRWSCVSSL